MDSVSVELDTCNCNPVQVLCAGSPLAPFMPDQFEPLESRLGKCPVEEPLWATPTSVIECLLSEPMEDEELPMGEDENEMAAWLHYLTNPTDNTQTVLPVAGMSSHLISSELLGRVAESDFQVHQPVLPDKDANLNCHLDVLRATSTINEKDSAQDLGVVNSNGNVQSDFEGHSESKNQGSPIESKSSAIGSSEKRKDFLLKSTCSRKSRTSEIHNLSERRRRSRINEKMKALQEIIPRSNKLDKASVLDETIAYVKFLQMQVKMLSTRCATRPWMCHCTGSCMPSRYTCMDMKLNNGGTNRAMCLQSGMTSHAPTREHMNQSIQTPMFQMPLQHDMAMEMPPSSHNDIPYHFFDVVSGQVEVSSQDLFFIDGKKDRTKITS